MFSEDDVRIHWKILKTRKSLWNNVFGYVKVYVFWKFIRYPIHWNKTQIKVTKTTFFFELKHKILLSYVGVSFSTLFCFYKSFFFSPKYMDSLTYLISFHIKIKNPHKLLLPDLWFLIATRSFKIRWYLRKSKVWEHHFFSIAEIFDKQILDIRLLINLFISLAELKRTSIIPPLK